MVNDLGRYHPVDSFWHASDPRTKLLLVMVLLIATVFCSGSHLIILTLLTGGLYLTARIPLKTVATVLWQFKWLIAFTFGANMTIQIRNEMFGAFPAAVVVTAKLVLSLLIANWLSLVTKPFSLLDGLVKLLKPLAFLRIPVGEFTLFAGLVVRLIPELIMETEQIIIAQRLRGIQPGITWKKSAQWVKCTFIPIFLATFRKATAIATAMEARGYRSGQSRTSLEELRFSGSDVILIIATLLGLICMVIWRR
jgi:energy-coupling factor transport system permease protein